MLSVPKIVGIVSCCFLPCPSPSNATQATERKNVDSCAERSGPRPDLMKCVEETVKSIDTVTGEVLRIEDNDLFVLRFNGKEVRLHLDANTQMTGIIGRGDRIEAKVDEVNDQRHALSIRQLK